MSHDATISQLPHRTTLARAGSLMKTVAIPHWVARFDRKIPTPIKIKLALPPPPFPKKPNSPPPLKQEFSGHGVVQQKEPKNARRLLTWRSHIRPQNCGRKNYGHADFSDLSFPEMQSQKWPQHSSFLSTVREQTKFIEKKARLRKVNSCIFLDSLGGGGF